MDFSSSDSSDEEILGISTVGKYQKMKEIAGVKGFIVNVHDSTNFDIDVSMNPNLVGKYKNVISNEYYYKDFEEEFLKNPNLYSDSITHSGIAYRCRLRGIGLNQLPKHLHYSKSNQLCLEIRQLIDRTDGWVTCTLSDIDIYKRLLVDIVLHLPEGDVNLRDYLLVKMRTEKDPLFYNYSRQK